MSFWRDRELEHIEQMIKDDTKLAKRLEIIQRQAMREIQQQIEAFYGRYATREGISMEEARKRITKLDIEEYNDKARRYVKERNFTDIANEEMRLYNVTMRINRLELLKRHIHLELLAMVSEEQITIGEELIRIASDEYERQSGILGMTVGGNAEHIATIVNSSFLTATWSDRLWNNQEALRAELDKLLNRGIVQGLNPRELARDLRKNFDTSVYNSERLLITELARVRSDVFKDSLLQAEFEEYRYIAEPTACDVCAELDDKIFKVKDMEIGVNMYPMHPFVNAQHRHIWIERNLKKTLQNVVFS